MSLRRKGDTADTEPKPARSAGAQTLERGLDLVDAVAQGVTTLEDLAARLELTRSTAHRLLTVLVRHDYLRHKPQIGYQLGPRLMELGFIAHHALHLPTVARGYLERLSAETGETAHLAVLDGPDVVYIDKVEGDRSLKFASWIGGRLPCHSTALGKILVAARPRDQWQSYFRPNVPRTARTITTFQAFEQELDRVQAQGYAIDEGEDLDNIKCVAAAIRDGSGAVVAGISVSSAWFYLPDDRFARVAKMVRQHADRISAELGWGKALRSWDQTSETGT